jgi:hypothetical protein
MVPHASFIARPMPALLPRLLDIFKGRRTSFRCVSWAAKPDPIGCPQSSRCQNEIAAGWRIQGWTYTIDTPSMLWSEHHEYLSVGIVL